MAVGLAFIFMVEANSWGAELSVLPYDLNTKESIVEIKGTKYRKIEYKGDLFYLRLLELDVPAKDLEISCGNVGRINTENQVLLSTRMTRRSSLFIEGLKQICKDLGAGKKTIAVDPNIQIGFLFDDSERSVFKNKQIYVNPLKQQIGVGAEW